MKAIFTIPKDQEWYWTKEWQAGEREADEDIKAGRVSPSFDNATDAIKYLDSVKQAFFRQWEKVENANTIRLL